ncbi:MAG: helix-turn-helix transcriptional regulator [Treponema sp.]|nr:helix-turn-helix transcriptional regulator [Treponema sp.]
MNITFSGAYYRKKEQFGFQIQFTEGTREYVLLHFYTPMVIVLNGRKTETQANACILYRPRTPQIYWGKFGEFENDYVRFLPEDSSFFSGRSIPLDEIFYADGFDVIKREMEDITYFLTERQQNHDSELKERLCCALEKLESSRIFPGQKAQRKSEQTFRLMQLREELKRSPEKWTVDAMAEHFFLTRSHFSVLWKKTFGVSPKADLRAFKNEKAMLLLSTTDFTMQKIAQLMNYNECENFIRMFKKMNGISPLQFRKRLRLPT